MLVTISGRDFDLAGVCTIDVPQPDFGLTARRTSRVATFDGAVVNDFGFSDSDRTMVFSWTPTQEQEDTIKRLVRYQERVRVPTPHGLMECVIRSYTVQRSVATLVLDCVARLSE